MFFTPENQLEKISKVENRIVDGTHGPIALRLFFPKNEGPLPIIVYFHRGGWVYGSIDESEQICRRLSNATESIVVAVEYRLSPEHKFPIPLQDCYEAAKWTFKNAPSYLGDPKKLIVCGESAGGNLAAAVSLMAQRTKEFPIAGQLLLYPILTNDLDRECYNASPDKSLLTYENMQFFWDSYLSSPEDGKNPHASPLKSRQFSGLPRTFVITAEYDALKHEGAKYAEELQRAGVEVQTKCYARVIHGFLDLPLADATKKKAMNDIIAWIKQ